VPDRSEIGPYLRGSLENIPATFHKLLLTQFYF
jgi:hypothetical protein